MKCYRCGIENGDSNKFCTNCGNILVNEYKPYKIICESCGAENELGYKYCLLCGELFNTTENVHSRKFRQKHTGYISKNKKNRKRKITSGNKSFGLKPFLITLVLIIISFITIITIDFLTRAQIPSNSIVESKSKNPLIEATVYEIASKFVCSCGNCGEQSLEKCTCKRAIEERQFIRDYLEKNSKKDDVVIALANKYGYLKSSYAKNYKLDPSKIWKGKSLILLPDSEN